MGANQLGQAMDEIGAKLNEIRDQYDPNRWLYGA